MASPESDELVVIARLVKPKGLKGELVADIITDFPERFENLDSVLIRKKDVLEKKIEYFRFEKKRIVFKFSGVDSIEGAENFRDWDVCIPESEVVELEEDEFFDWHLEGCEVRETDGNVVGDVIEIFRAGENVNLVVKGSEKEVMIPFVKAICTEVDLENKKIRVDLPEGLLDF